MFRVLSIPFPARSADGVHSLRRTRWPVYSPAVGAAPPQGARPMALRSRRQQSHRRNTLQLSQAPPRHTEQSNRCWTDELL